MVPTFSNQASEFIMTKTSPPIVVEQAFGQSKKTVWNAITQHGQMIQWFFPNIPDFNPVVGFRTEFDVDAGERDFKHVWTITEAVPEEKIVYDWRYVELPGAATVTFEVFDHGNGALLRVTNEGLDSFPAEIPEFSRESCEGGWQFFIQGRLKSFLEPADTETTQADPN
jgi:uncharacterized protein YndB with AHSA1/START domain